MGTERREDATGPRYLLLSLSRVEGQEIVLELGVLGNCPADGDELDELLLFLRDDIEAVVARQGQAALISWLDLVSDRLPYASCVQRRVVNSDNFYVRVALASSDCDLPSDLRDLPSVKHADEH